MRWGSVVPPSGVFWLPSSFPTVSLVPNDSGRASLLPICTSYASAGRLGVTTDVSSSVKPKLVATLVHRLNSNESRLNGAGSSLLPREPAHDHLPFCL